MEHLLTVFRRIDARKLLIPAFQRAFVWTESQILDLLESVYSGYPVGSILLWNVDKAVLKPSDSDDVPFPKGPVEYPADFVLDGLQRLSTLYGTFHFGSVTHNERFNVGFHLKQRRFAYLNELDEDVKFFVPLNALFNPRALLNVQQRLFKISGGEELVQMVLTLQSRFQEYMLPLVTLTEREPSEVVSIFERVNSTGTRLGRVDFMRAITWSSDFDLNDALDDIGNELREKNFDLADDTIVKALGLTFNLDPVPDVMLKLRDKSAGQLAESVTLTKKAFGLTTAFLKNDVHIMGSDFVPYEGQWLTLFNVFRSVKKIDDVGRFHLKKWFFTISVSEALQGRPDHFVARLIRRVTERIRTKSYDEFRSDSFARLNLDWYEIASRRMIKGRALSTALVSLLGEVGARSLVDGRLIPLEEYLRTFDTANFLPILSKNELPPDFGGDRISAKVFANLVLVPPSDISAFREKSVREILLDRYSKDDAEVDDILDSQLLPSNGARLKEENYFEFFERRGELILQRLQQITY